MMEIANRLNVTHATINYWMKKYAILRRSCSESAYLKINSGKNPFKLKKRLNKKENELLLTGLVLFWAEGSKAFRGSIQLANLDHKMLEIFAKFLREICGIQENKLRLYVRVYKRFDINSAKRYWARKLKMSPRRVFVYPHTDTRSKANKQWSKYGIATLQFHNVKLWEWLNKSIEDYAAEVLNK
ncbi:MAG: hypothetical protein Q7S07_05490 [Candidatus Omnitrophota bacterium]|nr:hypothetical protein [Candidatus Omnitrophota bacterium]